MQKNVHIKTSQFNVLSHTGLSLEYSKLLSLLFISIMLLSCASFLHPKTLLLLLCKFSNHYIYHIITVLVFSFPAEILFEIIFFHLENFGFIFL